MDANHGASVRHEPSRSCTPYNTRSPASENATATKTKKKEPKKTETKKKNRKGKKIISKDAAHGGLSHFVAPLYVAPSTTPGNAKPTSEFKTYSLLKK